jgi:hypothetical protein
MSNNILFVMPALRMPEYTRLAYESFMENTDPRHKIVIGLDLDNEEDKEYLTKHNVPFTVYEAWGGLAMADYEVLLSMEANDGLNFVGFIDNDMVFGYKWLEGFDHYCEDVPGPYDETLFCVAQHNFMFPRPARSPLPNIDYQAYLDFTKRHYKLYSNAGIWYREDYTHMPFIMSYDALDKTFEWMQGQDVGIKSSYLSGRPPFRSVTLSGGMFHFGNISAGFNSTDASRIQLTDYYVRAHANDPRYMKLARFWYQHVNQTNDHIVKMLKEAGEL